MTDVFIELTDVHRFYDDFEALKGISIKIKEGQIFGYLGPNGSGKTTTIKLLLGLIKPSSGYVKVFGENPYLDYEGAKDARKRVGSMLEVTGLYRNLTGLENLIFWAKLYGMKNQLALEKAKNVINLVKLSNWADVKVSKYSFGMDRRLALARALVTDPDILILDEPTASIDPESRYLIRNIMKELVLKGKTIFFSSHDLEEVQKVCSQVALLKKGELLSVGAIEDLINEFGKSRSFIRLKSPAKADLLAQRILKQTHDLKVEGPLVSFYPKDNFKLDNSLKKDILDSWTAKSSLEEAYLDLIKDEGVN